MFVVSKFLRQSLTSLLKTDYMGTSLLHVRVDSICALLESTIDLTAQEPLARVFQADIDRVLNNPKHTYWSPEATRLALELQRRCPKPVPRTPAELAEYIRSEALSGRLADTELQELVALASYKE